MAMAKYKKVETVSVDLDESQLTYTFHTPPTAPGSTDTAQQMRCVVSIRQRVPGMQPGGATEVDFAHELTQKELTALEGALTKLGDIALAKLGYAKE